ncbi:MAG: DUF3304 domain-containing protein [Telluria sp.]
MLIANLIRLVLMAALLACLLAACEKPTVDVSIHGVNYSGTAFSYSLSDPANPDRFGGGELIDPFAGGGTTCCFSLPRKWGPGIKMQIHSTHWLPRRPDGTLPEVKQVHLVDVPPYVDGKPGELWVLRGADGTMSVISSDFQPDHHEWPGKLKGWPVASLEYQRERWELIRKHEEEGVDLYVSLLDELAKSPHTRARESWMHATKYEPETIKNFSGPDDPAYVVYLKERYTDGLKRSKVLLSNVLEARP